MIKGMFKKRYVNIYELFLVMKTASVLIRIKND